MLTCEHCAANIATVEVSHSLVAVLQKVDSSGYSFFQCESGQDYSFVNYQHFECCQACLKAKMADCITNHYGESSLHPIPAWGGSTILHKVVLGSNLVCKLCNAALSTSGYRIGLTLCTPVNSVPDESQNERGEWCCSLEHAQQSALAIVSNI